MNNMELLYQLIDKPAAQSPKAQALVMGDRKWDYETLAKEQNSFAHAASKILNKGSRVGVWLSKSFEAVVASFGSTKSGHIFVPINPVLKAAQARHIINDCDIELIIISKERLLKLESELRDCPSVKTIVVVGKGDLPILQDLMVLSWNDFCQDGEYEAENLTTNDVAAIFYTSGSTGLPKGVVVPHRSLTSGASAVATYLNHHSNDRILAAMPLSFDAGFSQLTSSFIVGACCILLDYLYPSEVIRKIKDEKITGLTGVPPFWTQMSGVKWGDESIQSLRYFATTGGRMSRELLHKIRSLTPKSRPYLMYGLTEAFRSTYLSPDQIDNKIDSIGTAMSGQTVYVARPDGTKCKPNEVGELVHIGSTVCLGYWKNQTATNKVFKSICHASEGVLLKETAVFSGDQAVADEEGYLYFVARKDEMIKSSGYRISPVEIEDGVLSTGLVDDVIAFGVADDKIGQRISIVIHSKEDSENLETKLRDVFRDIFPSYMIPHEIYIEGSPLLRNPNGKIHRKLIINQLSILTLEKAAS
jgi:acyl-CoA ligase (AMP-forming) (exosortase A-associated)